MMIRARHRISVAMGRKEVDWKCYDDVVAATD